MADDLLPKTIYCMGNISIQPAIGGAESGPPFVSCSTGWVQTYYVPPFDPSQLDPSIIAAMFGGGFLLYLIPWAAAWGFSQMLKLLR